MKIKKIYYSSDFKKVWKRFSSKDRKQVLKREKIFRQNCFDPRLKTHKLTGKFKDCWSFSISYNVRIVFAFVNKDEVIFLYLGSHQIYR